MASLQEGSFLSALDVQASTAYGDFGGGGAVAAAADDKTNAEYYLDHAAHQNAHGVLCLRRGECGVAYHTFVAALSTLSKLRRQLRAELAQPQPPNQSSYERRNSNATTNCRSIPIPYLYDNAFYIYSSALVFSRRPSLGDDGSNTAQDHGANLFSRRMSQIDTVIFCEAIAQFNLGLVYHWRGKHCGEDRTLVAAQELYAQSFDTLQSIVMQAARTSHDVRVLKMAITNNRIHILGEMARYSDAQDLVSEFLVQSVETLSNNDSRSMSYLTRTDIDNFLLNALVIRRFNTSPCA